MSRAKAATDANILGQVVGTIRASSAISAQDASFYRSLDPSVGVSLDHSSHELLSLINEVILSIDENSDRVDPAAEGLESSWKNVSEVMDLLFEKSEHAMASLKRKNNFQQGKTLQYLDDSAMSEELAPKVISKPQLKFSKAVDNSESGPFRPLLPVKPNAVKPLEEVLLLTAAEDNIPAHFPQPYEYEIDTQEYDESVLRTSTPIPSLPWEGTDALWVDNKETFNDMLKTLSTARELAIDLEHHDYRTYYGITCLMQISTREQDWLVDTIALRDELYPLNEIFTNPKITKVLHGAFMDIIWLQRDLGLYIVSLFDTYHASRLLGFPKHSLAYLLEKYAHFKTSKKYQLSDWRVRPLTKALKAYARSDTHFLLNIYDNLRNELIERGKLAEVLHNSRNVAKRRFEYTAFRPKLSSSAVFSPIEREEPWRSLMFQYNIPPEKSKLVKKLYEWRDLLARRDDESPRFVAPNQLLVSLTMSAPTDSSGVLSVGSFVTSHVSTNAKSLALLIKHTLSTMHSHADPKMYNGEQDLTPELSLYEVEKNVSYFNVLTDNIQESSDQDKLLHFESVLFKGKPLPTEAFVSYEEGHINVVSSGEINLRSEKVSASSQISDIASLVSVEFKSTTPSPMSQSTSYPAQSSGQDAPSTVKEPTIEENKNDIVVLKERKHPPQKRPNNKSSSSPKEVLDFKNARKVLAAPSISIKSGKKRFDPYGDKEGPEGMKRRKKTRGLQKTFRG
ncbi:LADA_0B10242g1_1 [Lachancea dasiensis]|uniref:LADA_0B10242g1_1 n=1 Tax=Lachancea dasiensis TaxID=1072105 RepID=A0A1G4IVT7_9SACH|nr:LADA_0B10242g1_1 [Lachancea dasiensis]